MHVNGETTCKGACGLCRFGYGQLQGSCKDGEGAEWAAGMRPKRVEPDMVWQCQQSQNFEIYCIVGVELR